MRTSHGEHSGEWSVNPRPSLHIDEENEYANEANTLPLLPVDEAERIVEHLQEFPLQDIGGSKWFKQYRQIAKLNMQAHQSAMARSDEYILEALLTFDKLKVVIHEVLAIEAWKEFVLPRILETDRVATGKCTMRLYFTLYHEGTLCNLLEVIMYHAHVCEEAGDLLLDLVDYCTRKITMLIAGRVTSETKPPLSTRGDEAARQIEGRLADRTPAEEVRQNLMETEFRVCVTATALLRFLCEHLRRLPLGVMTRVLDTHDVLIGLVALIENPPWTRRTPEGTWQKFIDFEWRNVAKTDLLRLTKTEGQVWLAMYHILCDEECRKRYHLNAMRKSNILRVRKYLNNVLLDQLPVLASVQRYVDELSIMEVPESSSMPTAGGFLMEQIPQMREGLIKRRRWDDLAMAVTQDIFSNHDDAQDPDVRDVVALLAGGEGDV